MAIKRVKRTAVIILLALDLLITGVVIGPWAHVFFWSKVLDWHPDEVMKNRACLRLAKTKMGTDALYDHTGSSHKLVRQLSVYTLAYHVDPRMAADLLVNLPERDVPEKQIVLDALDSDVRLQYSWIHDYLHYEVINKSNAPRIRKRAAEVMQNLQKAAAGHLDKPGSTR